MSKSRTVLITGVSRGLGLAMAKHIVQAHGGQIWVESQMEKGAAFFFTLPTTQTKPTDDA